MMGRCWPFLRGICVITITETRKETTLFDGHRLWLVAQSNVFKTFVSHVIGRIGAMFLHGRPSWGSGASHIEGPSCVKRPASVKGCARQLIQTVWIGRPGGDILLGHEYLVRQVRVSGLRTKDLLYESKLSREMLKGSFSDSRLLWFEEVVDVFDLECQKDGFWGGDGWSNSQHVLCCIMCDPP